MLRRCGRYRAHSIQLFFAGIFLHTMSPLPSSYVCTNQSYHFVNVSILSLSVVLMCIIRCNTVYAFLYRLPAGPSTVLPCNNRLFRSKGWIFLLEDNFHTCPMVATSFSLSPRFPPVFFTGSIGIPNLGHFWTFGPLEFLLNYLAS